MPASSVTVSAPGKVLVTSGYLIVERPHRGISLAIGARVRTTVTRVAQGDAPGGRPRREGCIRASVAAPAIGLSAEFEYVLGTHVLQGGRQAAQADVAPASLVQITLRNTLMLVEELLSEDQLKIAQLSRLDIRINADNEFYSQREAVGRLGKPYTLESMRGLTPFCTQPGTAKTGLGSSAAVTASLVGAILAHFKLVHIGSTQKRHQRGIDMAHNLAQLCHAIAQNKVGSGFDIATAIYGSCIYSRYSPDVLSRIASSTAPALEDVMAVVVPGAVASMETRVVPWDHTVKPFALPKDYFLVVGDAAPQSGSATPSMVSAVFKAKTAAQSAFAPHWAALASCQDAIEQGFQRKDSDALKTAFAQLRVARREIGSLARVPIEPAHISPLLDDAQSVPGVIAAGTPGAGGNDAIFALAVGTNARDALVSKWQAKGVGVLGVWDGVAEGLRLEH